MPALCLLAALAASPAPLLAVQSVSARPAGAQQGAARVPTTAHVYFVDRLASGANDGTSWADAFTDLQSALAVAAPGEEVWVAAGTYHPEPPGGTGAASFVVPSGVALYGGFAGVEVWRGQRDPVLHPTILSGDIGEDDANGLVGLPNSWHVVRMSDPGPGTRLDGFRIEAGYAFFNPPAERKGAGLLLVGGTATIAATSFTGCAAPRGGGAFVLSSQVTFENCAFVGCTASDWLGDGGGAVVAGSSIVQFRDCLFQDNLAEAVGGWSLGGAIRSRPDTVVMCDGCRFAGNRALHRSGGGVDWCRGGAVFCEGDTRIRSSSFADNVSNVGGALQSWALLPHTTSVVSSEFSNNQAIGLFVSGVPMDGAGGSITGGGELSLIGVTVYGGHADNYGGAWVGSGGRISGGIFWGNTDSAGSIGRSNVRAGGDVEYSCVQNMLVGEPGEDPPDPAKFPGSIDADPLFADPPSGDLTLRSGSPCIDAADKTAYPAGVDQDADGAPRFVDDPGSADTGAGRAPLPDMGAHERQTP